MPNWLDVMKVGLQIGGGFVAGGPVGAAMATTSLLSPQARQLAKQTQDDPMRGAAVAAAGIREILMRSVDPQAMQWVSRFMRRWVEMEGCNIVPFPGTPTHGDFVTPHDQRLVVSQLSLPILIKQEGFNPRLYKDPISGQWHVAFGHDCESQAWTLEEIDMLALTAPFDKYPFGRNWDDRPCSRVEGKMILHGDLESSISEARTLLGQTFYTLPPECVGIVSRMCFQMGHSRVRKFDDMLMALHHDPPDFKAAAYEMITGQRAGTVSKWRKQTPNRCNAEYARMKALANRMEAAA